MNATRIIVAYVFVAVFLFLLEGIVPVPPRVIFGLILVICGIYATRLIRRNSEKLEIRSKLFVRWLTCRDKLLVIGVGNSLRLGARLQWSPSFPMSDWSGNELLATRSLRMIYGGREWPISNVDEIVRDLSLSSPGYEGKATLVILVDKDEWEMVKKLFPGIRVDRRIGTLIKASDYAKMAYGVVLTTDTARLIKPY